MSIDDILLPNGSKKISELPEKDEVSPDAYLVFERGTTSYKISYENFRQYVVQNLSAYIGLGNMAFKDSNEYSKFSHSHNYSDFFFFPSYGPQSNNNEYKTPEQCQALGQFTIINYFPGENISCVNNISVCMPSRKVISVDETLSYEPHLIGDIQMLGICCDFQTYLTAYRKYTLKNYGNKKNIDINDDSFDGFVIPNGTTFNCSRNDFQDACIAYSNTKDPFATSFTVPDINTFVKSNPGQTLNNAMQNIPYQNGLANHNHISSDGKQQINGSYIVDPLNLPPITFYQFSSETGQFGIPQFLHGGKGSQSTPSYLSITGAKINAIVNGLSCNTAGTNDESYPPYNSIPILIYIGKR